MFLHFTKLGQAQLVCLVVVDNEVLDGLLKLIKAAKMVGLQEFAL